MRIVSCCLALTAVLHLYVDVAYGKDYEVKRTVGGCEVVIKSDKNPPIAGDNNVSVEITDISGNRVSDPVVVVEYSRPARSGMPAMNYTADTVMKKGKYVGKMSLSLPGPWNVTVKIIRSGETASARLTVDVE
ncbi:MAG: FixH family protein [Nitrospiraceae bacterium]|nr:FixH family protein [Nitrospiraceae bacterium]